MNGIILVDKPAGMTSFKVTSTIKHVFGIKKAGHAGTLDPLASGVLPVMLGQATRLIDRIPDNTKTYVAGFMLGMTTDTLDSEGEVLSDQPVKVSREQLESVLNRFCGEISQVPPMYSALQKDGVRLYDLARQGIEVEREARVIRIHSITMLNFDGECAQIEVKCSKGTYIRTLIDDIGAALGCGAFMTSLRRTASNGFDIAECVPLCDITSSSAPQQYLCEADSALRQLDSVSVTDKQGVRFANGGSLDVIRVKGLGSAEQYRVYCGRFLGLGIISEGQLVPAVVIGE